MCAPARAGLADAVVGIGSSMVIAAVLRSGGPAGLAPGAEPIAIDWRAPSECPSADELRAGVVELLGTERASERVRVEVAVERRAELYVATMVLAVGARRSERELVAE